MQREKPIWKVLLVLAVYIIPLIVAVLFCIFNWGRWQGYDWLMCIFATLGALILSALTRIFIVGLELGLAK